MKRRFRFNYMGQNDNGEYWGQLTNLDILSSQVGKYRPNGSATRIITSGKSRADLNNRVREYVTNYPGKHPVELTINGETMELGGSRL